VHRLVRKVRDFDPGRSETLSAFFGCRLDDRRSIAISVGTEETGSGGWEVEDGYVEVASMVLRA